MGQALNFTGDLSQYAERTVNDQAFNFGSSDFTIQAWVNYNTIASEQVLVEKFYGSSGPGWTLTKLNADRYRFAPYAYADTPGLAITLDTWHQVMAERTGAEFKLYFDNQLVLDTGIGTIGDTDQGLLVGRRDVLAGQGLAMNGRIDDLAIWNRALSDSEITGLWNGGDGQDIVSSVPEPSNFLASLLAFGTVLLVGKRFGKARA